MSEQERAKKATEKRLRTLTGVMEREPSFAWRALMLNQAISDFADMVAKRFHVGDEVAFRLMFGGERLVGKVSKTQMEPNALAGTGLLVECDPETVERVKKVAAWRVFGAGERVLIEAGWAEIEYQEYKDARR